jgi:molecular chaperone GrpE
MSEQEQTGPNGPEGPGSDGPEGGESDIQAVLEEALREKDQFRALAQRVQADLENFKRRAAEEKEDLRKFGKSQVILKVLGVSDDFRRAMDMVPADAVAPGWREGLELVQRGIDHLLEAEGVTAIEAQGEPFEPAEHEAVMFQETTELEAGRVLAVVRNGYKQNGRVLRAAQVTVSKAP